MVKLESKVVKKVLNNVISIKQEWFHAFIIVQILWGDLIIVECSVFV